MPKKRKTPARKKAAMRPKPAPKHNRVAARRPVGRRPATKPSPGLPLKVAAPPTATKPSVEADEASSAAETASPFPSLPLFTVVGVGASAGGLEACTQVLRALPPRVEFALVIVQHLDPERDSILPELLGDATSIPLAHVVDRSRIEPNHIYVIPPNAHLEIDAGTLRLLPRPLDRTQHMPIDHFFRSLAEHAQARAVGVVLSGTATDGAAGLKEIKAAGGIAVAQDPQTARFDGMPRSAIATGVIDLVLPPEQIAAELVRVSGIDHASAPAAGAALGADQLAQIFALLRNVSGVDFTHYKLPTIRRRLQRRMVLHKVGTVEEYIGLLRANPAEQTSLYQDLLIHVTRFFRDADTFTTLADKVFPQIGGQRRGATPIRLWVPGCSTGEEAYSLAIALLEFLGDDAASTPIQIFATDVSELAIDQARNGVYPDNIAADVSAVRLRRYFSRIDGSYRISKSVRDLCVFARQDLTRDPPFSKLDLILCRNVLIYLGPALQKKLMNVFHYALKPTGFLMLGAAESIGQHGDLFGVADKRHKLYLKKPASSSADLYFPNGPGVGQSEAPRRAAGDARLPGNVQGEATRLILARFSPPSVLVDNDLKIIQFRGQTGPFLEPSPGDASLDLLKMAREGLLHGLRTALNEARKGDRAVRREGLRVRQDGKAREVAVEVIPLAANEGRHFLVLFDPALVAAAKGRGGKKEKKAGPPERPSRGRLRRLEEELAASREYLQSMIQDLEAANEELQSANEEILSSNEELQSTNEELDTAKEELQSTNEELNTVNEELQSRNEELSRANSDLVNLLGSVQIAIVMVANDLRIRRFTPMAERVLNLIPTDVGRPISDIKPNIDCPELEQLIADVIDNVTTREVECPDRNGNRFLLRVRPYKNVENRIDGAVLALFEVADATRRYDADLRTVRDARDLAEAIVAAVNEPVIVLDADLKVQSINRSFEAAFGIEQAEAWGKRFFDFGEGRWDVPVIRTLLQQTLPERGVVDDVVVEQEVSGGGVRDVRLTARRVSRPDGAALTVIAMRLDGEVRHDGSGAGGARGNGS